MFHVITVRFCLSSYNFYSSYYTSKRLYNFQLFRQDLKMRSFQNFRSEKCTEVYGYSSNTPSNSSPEVEQGEFYLSDICKLTSSLPIFSVRTSLFNLKLLLVYLFSKFTLHNRYNHYNLTCTFYLVLTKGLNPIHNSKNNKK